MKESDPGQEIFVGGLIKLKQVKERPLPYLTQMITDVGIDSHQKQFLTMPFVSDDQGGGEKLLPMGEGTIRLNHVEEFLPSKQNVSFERAEQALRRGFADKDFGFGYEIDEELINDTVKRLQENYERRPSRRIFLSS